jgi:DNA modification methylase
MKTFTVKRNTKYDYAGQSYSTLYPNLHKYPATMIPQLGIDLLKDFGAMRGKMLDPYCGSGSSFICGLECGLDEMEGYDLNPLAVLISKARFTKLNKDELENSYQKLRDNICDNLKNENLINEITLPYITNIDFWFSKPVIDNLAIIKDCIDKVENEDIKNLFLVPFSITVRECSLAKINEFKLVRMKSDEILNFNPDVISFYLRKLVETIFCYKTYYLPKLTNKACVSIFSQAFEDNNHKYDVVLTSPPYGDSRTTVAYGQFSTLSNEWLGLKTARKIDGLLMGGKKSIKFIDKGVIAEPISQIEKIDKKRASEVSAFYEDLEDSIKEVSNSVSINGKVMYIVGNRTVKNTPLPTDQFIAEKFEENGLTHLMTYERLISNKVMPSRNSPTNETGKTVNTMLFEYIVVCGK